MTILNPQVAVIGAGPAGLMAAEVLAQGGAAVTVYDAMPSAGRKFLMAGRGGLNLTHSEALPEFLTRYGEAQPLLATAIKAFPPENLRAWSEALGQPTFIGSSGRVFPTAFKASPLLRAWLRRLDAMGVQLALRHRWTGWNDEGHLLFQTPDGRLVVDARATVLALGGASWPRLGSNGAWVERLAAKGVVISPLRPANCGFTVAWSEIFRDRFEGQPLKGIALSFGPHTVRGEVIITRAGLEGGASALGCFTKGHREFRAGNPAHRIAPRSATAGLDCTAIQAARQAVPVQFSAQGRSSVAGRHRPVAGGGDCIRRAAVVAFVCQSRGIDQRRAGRTQRCRADRARDLDRRRNIARRARRRFHDPLLARCLRRRRDARLGSADRRLFAAGLVRDRRRGGKRGAEIFRSEVSRGPSRPSLRYGTSG